MKIQPNERPNKHFICYAVHFVSLLPNRKLFSFCFNHHSEVCGLSANFSPSLTVELRSFFVCVVCLSSWSTCIAFNVTQWIEFILYTFYYFMSILLHSNPCIAIKIKLLEELTIKSMEFMIADHLSDFCRWLFWLFPLTSGEGIVLSSIKKRSHFLFMTHRNQAW